jgi:hypothetical protein
VDGIDKRLLIICVQYFDNVFVNEYTYMLSPECVLACWRLACIESRAFSVPVGENVVCPPYKFRSYGYGSVLPV